MRLALFCHHFQSQKLAHLQSMFNSRDRGLAELLIANDFTNLQIMYSQWQIKDLHKVGALTVQGCTNTQSCWNFQKLHEIERMWTPGGGGGGEAHSSIHQWSANDSVIKTINLKIHKSLLLSHSHSYVSKYSNKLHNQMQNLIFAGGNKPVVHPLHLEKYPLQPSESHPSVEYCEWRCCSLCVGADGEKKVLQISLHEKK